MQLRGLLFLGLALGTEGSKLRFRAAPEDDSLVRRQATNAATPHSTAVEVVTATSTVADTTSTSPDESISSSSAGGSSDSGSSNDITTSSSSSEADKTVTDTVTVTDASADTITKSTTVLKTLTSTILVTSTAFKTDTVTSSGKTATSTVYETSTKWANEKRALNIAPRTVGEDGIVIHEAEITQAPRVDLDEDEYQLLRPREMLAKRDTVTVTTTVTVGGGNGKTITKSATRTVISTISSETKVTKTITETEQADASTTVTTTSTLTITSTRVTTGVVQTATVAPSGSYGSDGDSSNNSSSSGSSGGLSTGAKAGIGAGAGVVGLIVLGILLWCCLKRRNKPSKSDIDDMFGSSEVPVGPGPVRDSSARYSSNHMSQMSPTIPNVAPVKAPAPEGYRGTALGDGRAGYANLKKYGAAYAPPAPTVSPEGTYSRTATTTSGRDEQMEVPPNAVELGNDGNAAKWHQNDAAEIDGNQVSSLRGTSPPEHVYEMPTQEYR